jgi:hypothetical protein
MVDAPSDDEWNWLFHHIVDENGNVVHEDDVYGSEPNEIETDPQYGRIDRNSY